MIVRHDLQIDSTSLCKEQCVFFVVVVIVVVVVVVIIIIVILFVFLFCSFLFFFSLTHYLLEQ
jgi:hypothetical protein